ncbi:TPA: hypothetical protein R8G72_004863 [Citrobacter youngae]|uniref:hypothetical protein n=1 Tax=Citrobacter sp. FDAARGOS_156 TaxID=1702170 RepID=UPI001901565F|nr:hypothetical protein [Citrobacter sp. FDAARGOS_156]HEE0143086.1 hypothetical protein [Citrobacter youngae]MBJ9556572.1 hypothetical protein [Citrobacter sp. FDAARGOS_156]HEE0143794.1 hypothetical protein [Citrobacter youngae]HEF0070522.1 hypothetical protein [Citrobacter youngae]HEF0074679.1 hypothetical protein [Citrobacter youngae]
MGEFLVNIMKSDFFINLLMSLATGGYMGIVVSKAVAFSNIKKEALRIVRTIDTLGPNGLVFHKTENVTNLLLLSSELMGLKHKKAAGIINNVFSDINKEIFTPSLDSSIRDKILSNAQKSIRTLPPSRIVLFNPFDFSL